MFWSFRKRNKDLLYITKQKGYWKQQKAHTTEKKIMTFSKHLKQILITPGKNNIKTYLNSTEKYGSRGYKTAILPEILKLSYKVKQEISLKKTNGVGLKKEKTYRISSISSIT